MNPRSKQNGDHKNTVVNPDGKLGNEVVRWSRVKEYLTQLNYAARSGGDDKLVNSFIPENIFYRLAMKAKNETAEAFQAKVVDEIPRPSAIVDFIHAGARVRSFQL